MNKLLMVAGAGILMLAGFFVATSLYQDKQTEKANANSEGNIALLNREHSPRLGNPNAKVILVEFFDPGCETCKAFHPLVKQIMEENPGKIQLVMRYAPFHKGSDYVSAILEGAREQNKFWEALEATYAAQDVWASHGNPQPNLLWMQLGNVGLDFKQLEKDMKNEKILKNLNQDIADLQQLNIRRTPSFFVNGKPLVEFGISQLKDLIESEIKIVY